MPLDVPQLVASYLGYDLDTTWGLCRAAPRTYRRFCISKTSGGHRAIYHPSSQTKAIQYALMNLVLKRLDVHPSASAYVHDRSIVWNAKAHARFHYTVKVDFSNFFPSIRPVDILLRIEALPGGISADSAEFITNALFVEYRSGQRGLAVGAPSSPMASNAAMLEIDTMLTAFALSRGGCYTRYADDIAFSTDAKGQCSTFVEELGNIIAKTASPRLRINARKTSYASCGTRRTITGLIITPMHSVSVGREKKRYIRKMMFDLSRNALSDDDAKYLRGYLAFLQGVEPDVLNRLALKYGASLLDRARKGQPAPAVMTTASGY